jgi:isochorismate pyruvate lyase
MPTSGIIATVNMVGKSNVAAPPHKREPSKGESEEMDAKKPWECADMGQVRSEIDKIDAQLVDLIADRFGYVDRAWQIKQTLGSEGAVVPWRIQQVIEKVRNQAVGRGLPPEMVEMVGSQWRNMIGWFVQYEEEKLRKATECDTGLHSGDLQGLDLSLAPKDQN